MDSTARHSLQLACKPDSVRFWSLRKNIKTGFHHLSCPGITAGIHTTYPPASDEQPFKPVYMVFQPIRCTAPGVATRTGELLPHLFTLPPTVQPGDGYFLLHYYTLTDIFPLGSMVLCVARTFLPDSYGRNDGTACCAAKLVKIC